MTPFSKLYSKTSLRPLTIWDLSLSGAMMKTLRSILPKSWKLVWPSFKNTPKSPPTLNRLTVRGKKQTSSSCLTSSSSERKIGGLSIKWKLRSRRTSTRSRRRCCSSNQRCRPGMMWRRSSRATSSKLRSRSSRTRYSNSLMSIPNCKIISGTWRLSLKTNSRKWLSKSTS